LPYLYVGLDVLFITTVVWLFYREGGDAARLLLLCGGLSLAVILSALYHSPGASVFGGMLAVGAYLLFHLARWVRAIHAPQPIAVELLTGVPLLALTAFVAYQLAVYLRWALEVESESVRRLREVVQRVSEVVFALDSRGMIVWAGGTLNDLLGTAAEQLQGRYLNEVLELAPGPEIPADGLKGTFLVRSNGDTARHVDCALWPSRSRGGEVAWEGILSDASERERACADREEMLRRLFRYQKMESLGVLASGMAHDFNNVIQVVGDTVDGVLCDSREPAMAARLTDVKNQIAKARFLACELLSLGRDYELSFDHIELRSFLAMVIVSLREQLEPKYRLEYAGQDDPLSIRGDARHLRRVLENLVHNACDAMPDGGGVTISAVTEHMPAGVDCVILRVVDTGPGIPEHVLHTVFDPFVTTKERGKGTGLGLALVQHLMNLHKGTISVEQSGPTGTTFRLQFPAADNLEVDHETRWMLSARRSARLLVLDDDPRIREVLLTFLVGLKYDTCEAGNLAEARRELLQWRSECRVLILDWRIEGAEPEEVVRELRAIVPNLIVIVVSGYPPDHEAIRELDICRWFTKPYDRNLLDVEIQRRLYLANKQPT